MVWWTGTVGGMAIHTTARDAIDGDERARTTRWLVIATAVLAVPQLALAAYVAIVTWVELDQTTAAEQTDSWTELGYVVAAVVAVPPLVAAAVCVPAWVVRHRTLGAALAIVGMSVSGLALWFELPWLGSLLMP